MDSRGFVSGFSLVPTKSIAVMNFYVWHGRLLCDAVDRGHGMVRIQSAENKALHSFGFGRLDGKECVLHVLDENPLLEEQVHFAEFRALAGTLSETFEIAANHALQVGNWLSVNRHCCSCGTRLYMASDELRLDCPCCARQIYPACTPVCIGVVTRGREILLARSPHFPPGVYSALAGYLQLGESAEDCIRREIYEETRIHISTPQWCASQGWPYPHSLMLGFHAQYAGGDIQIDRTEIEDAAWFQADRLPLLPHTSTLGYRLIKAALSASCA